MTARAARRGAVVVAGAAVLVAGGGAVALAQTSGSPTSLCVSEGQQVTAARADSSGVLTCPSGRTLVVLASESRLQQLRDDVAGLFVEVDRVEQRLAERLVTAESRLQPLEDAVADLGPRVGGLEAAQGRTGDELQDARARLASLESRVTAVERRTAVSTRTATASFAATSTPRVVVGCGTGARALSGSARTADASVVQSSVTDDGASWTFDLRSTGKAPSATLLVVCAGASGSTGPTAEPSSPSSPTGPTAEPAPVPGG